MIVRYKNDTWVTGISSGDLKKLQEHFPHDVITLLHPTGGTKQVVVTEVEELEMEIDHYFIEKLRKRMEDK
jgi:hypothetical protein